MLKAGSTRISTVASDLHMHSGLMDQMEQTKTWPSGGPGRRGAPGAIGQSATAAHLGPARRGPGHVRVNQKGGRWLFTSASLWVYVGFSKYAWSIDPFRLCKISKQDSASAGPHGCDSRSSSAGQGVVALWCGELQSPNYSVSFAELS